MKMYPIRTIFTCALLSMGIQASAERTLKLEVWYPASASDTPSTVYQDVMRSGAPLTLKGAAKRDVAAAKSSDKYPLIVLSHGYTGYRSLMFYLGEHLASHGYVVASIDHTDSTNADVAGQENPFIGFPSTLLHRATDQQGTIDALVTHADFKDLIDENHVGVVGYSMGGYGAVNTAGTCYGFSQQAAGQFTGTQDPAIAGAIQKVLNRCSNDERVKAIVALAPWGSQHGLFEENSVAEVKTPALFVSGDQDDISDYPAIHKLYEKWGADDKYMLTFANARHNIGGHPTPPEAYANGIDVTHYIDGTWSTQRINATVEHFALAMMDCHVKRIEAQCAYLTPGDKWFGFTDRFATGLKWEQAVTE
jgi:predicted dienelactone hydrolase